ncbi:MAG: aminotransferase class I/II-fold pyridoxal phosphate-dependent enzyme [Bacteroidetes bacterium]|nr:aminotransferase class I/II-fold pyridoxal phosphate-dependent enzyme [Bacteroidota bacterium]
MAETLIGSEIIKQANDVNEKIKKGEKIYNFTIGDFDPKIFPIPTALLDEILDAYRNGHTNYPMANGMPDLRKAVSNFIRKFQLLDYSPEEILISGGSRPLIYAVYKTLIDPGDKVVFPVPSWNNNHYCHLSQAEAIMVETTAENNFMPTAAQLKPYIKDARMLALCSPLNPTGTVFSKEALEEIAGMVLEENKRRTGIDKPLYIMYDQVYSILCFGETQHHDPVSLFPELRPYTICIDGISKAFAATGVRLGWAFGPDYIVSKMKSILSHVGAWSPKAEQVATARFLENEKAVEHFLKNFLDGIEYRLTSFYQGFLSLRAEGFLVDVISPQAAIYLTVQFDLIGSKTKSGKIIATTQDITDFLCDEAKLAVVPFSSFGSKESNTWYRLSVGVAKSEEIPDVIEHLRKALTSLE